MSCGECFKENKGQEIVMTGSCLRNGNLGNFL